MKRLDHQDPYVQSFLAEFFRLKTLAKLGIQTDGGKYSPMELEILCRISHELKVLENKALEDAKKG